MSRSKGQTWNAARRLITVQTTSVSKSQQNPTTHLKEREREWSIAVNTSCFLSLGCSLINKTRSNQNQKMKIHGRIINWTNQKLSCIVMEEEEAMQQPLTDSSLTTHSLTSDEEQLHSETLSLHSSARKLRFNNTFFFSVIFYW